MSLLKQFLERTKQNLVKFQQTQQDHLQSQSVIHIVLGNEAADADSLISTLCYAFLKDLTRGDSAKRKGQGMDLDVLFIPASGVSRSDLPLRRDVQLALQKVNLSFDDLFCLDEILHHPSITAESITQKQLQLTLCDHNALAAHLEDTYGSTVVEIIDHHVDRGFYPWIQHSNPSRTIVFSHSSPIVMSTCTLIAEKFLSLSAEEGAGEGAGQQNNQKGEEGEESSVLIPADVATLLLAVIAVDSSNLSTATPRDLRAVAHLQEISPYPSTDLFTLLSSAKLDPVFWKGLTVSDALRLDYKLFQVETVVAKKVRRIGIASVLQPVTLFFEKKDCAKAVYETMKRQNLSCYAVMTFVSQPTPTRQLVVYSHCSDHLQGMCAHLSDEQRQLDLSLAEEQHPHTTTSTQQAPLLTLNVPEDILLLHSAEMVDHNTHPETTTSSSTTTATTTATASPHQSSSSTQHLYAKVFYQGNTRASRKMVAPLIVGFEENR